MLSIEAELSLLGGHFCSASLPPSAFGRTWLQETFCLLVELCRDLELVHCVNPLQQRPVTDGTAYFRLHGITGYRYRHSEDDFRRLLDLCAGFDEAYCLFNNMTMFEDAARFKALALKSRSTVG